MYRSKIINLSINKHVFNCLFIDFMKTEAKKLSYQSDIGFIKTL